jgi:late competence protein required for DNA uptake (superfamily II DNA/RNA helicase)
MTPHVLETSYIQNQEHPVIGTGQIYLCNRNGWHCWNNQNFYVQYCTWEIYLLRKIEYWKIYLYCLILLNICVIHKSIPLILIANKNETVLLYSVSLSFFLSHSQKEGSDEKLSLISEQMETILEAWTEKAGKTTQIVTGIFRIFTCGYSWLLYSNLLFPGCHFSFWWNTTKLVYTFGTLLFS